MTNYQKVRDFHLKMGIPAPVHPTPMDDKTWVRRVTLIEEERKEFVYPKNKVGNARFLEEIQELCDLLYVTYGTFVEMGIDPTPFFQAIHTANMTKDPGNKRRDGKVLKGKNYQAPDMLRVYESLS